MSGDAGRSLAWHMQEGVIGVHCTAWLQKETGRLCIELDLGSIKRVRLKVPACSGADR